MRHQFPTNLCQDMVELQQVADNSRIIFGATEQPNIVVAALALCCALLIIEFLVNIELGTAHAKVVTKSRGKQKPSKINTSPMFPGFFQQDTIPQIIQAEWNAQIRGKGLPSNFVENALSGFNEFGEEQETEPEDLISTGRRVFRTNQSGVEQKHHNLQLLSTPRISSKMDSKPYEDISELIMRHTSYSFNSFNLHLAPNINLGK